MSIVIAVLEENKEINIFADRRLATELNNKIINSGIDEITKVYELTDTLSCGFTGDPNWGIQLAQELIQNSDKLPSELIKIIETFQNPIDPSTFTFVGLYDDKKLFIYGFETLQKKRYFH